LSEMGAVIAPPVPAFYAKPRGLEDVIDHTLGRVLDLFGLDTGTVTRWGEPASTSRRRAPKRKPLSRNAGEGGAQPEGLGG